MNKKLIALTLAVGAFLMTTGCTKSELDREPADLVSISNVESQTYTAYGRYYTHIKLEGMDEFEGVITNDGNAWKYCPDTISDRTPVDGMPVWVGFSDNGTPNDIYDDVILGLVYDRNTAIYDDLVTALGDSFQLERDGNNIRIIKGNKNVFN